MVIGVSVALALAWTLSAMSPAPHQAFAIFALGGSLVALAAVTTGGALAHINEAFAQQVARNLELDSLIRQSEADEKKFWSGISHDLRTPLNSILGYTELLIEEMPDEDRTTVKTDLERVKTAGFDLLLRINDLLAVSDLKAGSPGLHVELTDVNRLVNDLAAVLTPLAARQNNELRIILPGIPCIVRTDAVRLERILLALATNAMKFTNDGTVTLEVDYSEDNQAMALAVRDTGSGFRPAEFELTHAPWQDASLGFGLSVCKHLVDEMGGSMQVESTPGEGSTFSLSIPAPRAVQHQPGDQTAPQPSSPPNILIVDENEDAADLLSRHLRRFGCHVTISVDGALGKDLAVDLQPDLIIMEVEMTSIDGWAVLKHLKFDSRTRDIPVVISSSRDMRAQAYEMGAVDYLIKPISASTALAGLKRVTTIGPRLADTEGSNVDQ